MEELLLLKQSEKRPNLTQENYDYYTVIKIIEQIFANDYVDDSLKILKKILVYSKKPSRIDKFCFESIKQYVDILIREGIISKKPASEYFSSPIFRIYSDNYYLLRHVRDYMDLQDKKKLSSEISAKNNVVITGNISSFDQQTESELSECKTLDDLELLRDFLHKTHELNVKTSDANHLIYQRNLINNIIDVLLSRKVISQDMSEQINFSVSIVTNQKRYFIDQRYLAQL